MWADGEVLDDIQSWGDGESLIVHDLRKIRNLLHFYRTLKPLGLINWRYLQFTPSPLGLSFSKPVPIARL